MSSFYYLKIHESWMEKLLVSFLLIQSTHWVSIVAHQDQQTTGLQYRHAQHWQFLELPINACYYYWQDIKEVKISYSITMKEKMPIFVSRLKVLKNAGCFRNTRIRRDYEKTIIIFDSYNVSYFPLKVKKSVCCRSLVWGGESDI